MGLIKFKAPTSIRPTTAKNRLAIFNVLRGEITDWETINGLDLFAGSGALGLTALLEGAKQFTFIDNFSGSLESIKENANKFKQIDKCKIIKANACKHQSDEQFDLIFADPPYNIMLKDLINLFNLIQKALLPGGIFVFEMASKRNSEIEDLIIQNSDLRLLQKKNYGDTNIYFCTNQENTLIV